MIGPIILLFVGIGAIGLGLKGFTPAGIPWSGSKTIKGNAARIIGAICLLLGIPVALMAFYAIIGPILRGES